MAGRGRGRGRGGLSFNTDALGIQRGDIISIPGLQPPPLFPPLQYKPLPLLDSSQSQKYLMDVKQEIQVKFRQSPFFITLDEKKCDIERYSDRYQPSHQEVHKKWTPDWNMFPEELRPKKRRKMGTVQPNLAAAKQMGALEDVLSKLEEQEEEKTRKNSIAAENSGNEEEDEENKEKEEEEQVAEDEEEFEEEEETDYNLTYFDNGEGYGDDDDDDDEPAYS